MLSHSNPFRALVDSLLSHKLEEIVSKSRLHCHTAEVHSVVLTDSIRLFFATKKHQLWKNNPRTFKYGMSVGFHAHHCDLTIHCLTGVIGNWIVEPGDDFAVGKYQYRSALRGQSPGFDHLGAETLKTAELRALSQGSTVFMPAAAMHTIYAANDNEAAWLVFEGTEDPAYNPVCYSTADLSSEPMQDLYKPMTAIDLMEILHSSGLS